MQSSRYSLKFPGRLEMLKYGALMAVLSNLEIPVYVKDVLGDVDDMVREMQNITSKEVEDAKRSVRLHQPKRIHIDALPLLQEFVDRILSLFEYPAACCGWDEKA